MQLQQHNWTRRETRLVCLESWLSTTIEQRLEGDLKTVPGRGDLTQCIVHARLVDWTTRKACTVGHSLRNCCAGLGITPVYLG